MIWDIDDDIEKSNSRISSFANDIQISQKIINKTVANLLQIDLNNVCNWADLDNLNFNNERFEVIQYGTRRNIGNIEYVRSHILEVKEPVKDQGMIMSKDCTFSEHIETTIKIAKQMSGRILRM